jgi:TolB protein
MRNLLAVVAFAYALFASRVGADVTIEITTEGSKPTPIVVLPFAAEERLPQGLTKTVGADLANTGLFKLIDVAGVNPIPREAAQVNFGDWRARGADVILIGGVESKADGRFEVKFRLLDALKETPLLQLPTFLIHPNQARRTAHKIADLIYENLTGDKGVFSTQIAYVVKDATRYHLKVADYDGQNEQTVVSSPEPIMSPAWSPDGTRMVYVSFELKKPVVVVQNLATGSRRVVANFKGSNSAPAWSPDAKKLAVTLTKDGGSQLYIIDVEGGGAATRLATSPGIDTEPTFSPDGSSIAFTSDRGGSPQIYRIATTGGETQRMTFNGTYNVTPRYSPDGKRLAYIQRVGGQFKLVVQDLESGQIQALTDTNVDESPTIAPNGRTILYATQSKGRGILATVSSDGRIKQRFSTQAGDMREPAWGPFQ